MKVIGVFDSGIGGLSVANAIQNEFPKNKVIFVNDNKNVPYGTKSKEELKKLVKPIINELSKKCDVIVIACNTVTTTLIKTLRSEISIPLIGMEPMIKPASVLTKSKIIAVFATPTTLASYRYAELVDTYAKDISILQPDCSDWSYMIETNQVDKEKIRIITQTVCNQGADIIVLGCTHYHWIEGLIKKVAQNKADVLQPEQPVIKRLKQILTS